MLIKLACAQMDISPGQINDNLKRISELSETAASQGADIIAFPECALTDYYVEDFASLASPIPGEQSDAIVKLAEKNCIWIIVGLLERTAEGIYNTAILVSPEKGIMGKYRKTHLSVTTRNETIAKEVDVFLPGEDLPVFDTPFGLIGIMICKDGEITEVPRTLAVRGASIIVWPTNCPEIDELAAQYHAKYNCIVLMGTNSSAGYAEGGRSLIVDWRGETLANADKGECLIFAEIDKKELEKNRMFWWRHDRTRRPELYDQICLPYEWEKINCK